MRAQTCKTFARLLEGFVVESSSTMSMVADIPGGSDLVKYLHKERGLSHNVEYTEVDKIAWRDLKDRWRQKQSWVLIRGTNGAASIILRQGEYAAVTSTTTDGIETDYSESGAETLKFIKSKIGKPEKFYVDVSGADYALDLQRKRQSNKQAPGLLTTSKSLAIKFKPLWARVITYAIADIKGHIINVVKNDGFHHAKKKLNHIKALHDALDGLENSSQIPDIISESVELAIYMAASYHYPDQTGSIKKRYSGYDTQFTEGPKQLISDIAQGDTSKLATVLSFFKKALVSG